MKRHLSSLLLCALLLAACGTAELTAVSVPPNATQKPTSTTPVATPLPPPSTLTPTNTPVLTNDTPPSPTSTSTPADTPLPSTSTPTAIRTESPTPGSLSQAGATRVWEKDGSVMVYVPAGTFWMGSTSAEIGDAVAACVAAGGSQALCARSHNAEAPRHEIYVDAFWIERTEVTNAQYRKCVEAGTCEEPTISDWGAPTNNDDSKAEHPVVCVDWNDATTYCQWSGKRLQTEAEWEKATRGTDGLIFPWGDTFDGRLLNFCDVNCESERKNVDWDDGYAGTARVGSYAAGENPYRAWDMAGNVWEWVSDWYNVNYYGGSPQSNPPGPGTGTEKVARGGSWYGLWHYARAATRRGHDPSDRGSIFGFRCADEATNLPPTTSSTQPPAPGDTRTRPADSMTMVYVPGGEFQMGSTADDPQAVPDELLAHTVTLDSFWIDQTLSLIHI